MVLCLTPDGGSVASPPTSSKYFHKLVTILFTSTSCQPVPLTETLLLSFLNSSPTLRKKNIFSSPLCSSSSSSLLCRCPLTDLPSYIKSLVQVVHLDCAKQCLDFLSPLLLIPLFGCLLALLCKLISKGGPFFTIFGHPRMRPA